jgi:hypothetical protein
MKRTVDELEGYKELLYSLLDTLRSENPATVDRLLTVIRSNDSLNDIAVAVSENIRELRSKIAPGSDPSSNLEEAASKAEQLQHIPEAYSRRRFMMLENLCDIPLFNVPAKPWTTVTDDTQFVSHLVSLYFTWNHPFSQFIDQQTFLEHMISGDLESQFCSPFLVNSLLAVASVCHPVSLSFALTQFLSDCVTSATGLLRFSRGFCFSRRPELSRWTLSCRSRKAMESGRGEGHLIQHTGTFVDGPYVRGH